MMEDLKNIQSDDFKDTRRIINDTKADILYAMSNWVNKAVSGLDTGYSEPNKMTNGLKKGEIIVIASRPSVKSVAFASEELRNDCQIVLNALRQDGITLVFASQELRADHKIVKEAIQQCEEAIEYASKYLKTILQKNDKRN
jgi:replicative DNA helicase